LGLLRKIILPSPLVTANTPPGCDEGRISPPMSDFPELLEESRQLPSLSYHEMEESRHMKPYQQKVGQSGRSCSRVGGAVAEWVGL